MSEAEDEGKVVRLSELRAAADETDKKVRAQMSADMPAETAGWEEAALPKREWLVEGFLLRGSVTLIAGQASAGKSLMAQAMAVSCALGMDWGSFRPKRQFRVSTLNVEDDDIEQKRRISATLRQFERTPFDLGDRLARLHPKGVPTLLRWVVEEDGSNSIAVTRLMDLLEAHVAEHKPDVLFIDPLIEIFAGDETNEPLRAMVAFFRMFAGKHNLAVVLVHHSRKGSEEDAGKQDMVRGGSSLTAAARVVLTCMPMSPRDAGSVGIDEKIRHQFVRLDGAKMNYSSRGVCYWFEKYPYLLENDEITPALIPWTPPQQPGLDQDLLLTLAAAVGHGVGGQPYSSKLDNRERSIRRLFRQNGITLVRAEKDALAALYKMGIEEAVYWSVDRKETGGLRDHRRYPAVKWCDEPSRKVAPLAAPLDGESAPLNAKSAPLDDVPPLEWDLS